MTVIRSLFAAAGLPLLLLVLGFLSCAPARAQTTLNFDDDISVLIQTVSEVTGYTFIVDQRVKGKVTVVSSGQLDNESLYELFLAVLQVQGYSAVPSGNIVKIVPQTGVRAEAGPTPGDLRTAVDDELVTKVYEIQNVSAVQLVPLLRPLVPQWGHLAAAPQSNMLIISDRAANIKRLEVLINQIDQTADREIDMLRLEHALATDVVRTVTLLNQGDRQNEAGTTPALVIADERSNSVLIGGDKSERQKMMDIIVQLDVPIGEGGSTQVIYLKYASAENLAPILEGYAKKVSEEETKGGSGAATPGASSGARRADALVVADTEINALIVTAQPKSMRQIRDVVQQLDIRRAQVLVEGLVAEVSANKSATLGIDWAVFNDGAVAAAGILDPTTLSALANVAAADSDEVTTAAATAVSQGINLVGGSVDDSGTSFAVLLKALSGDGDSNVLSTPTLTTLDNEEAEFTAGQEVPFLTGSFSNTGSSTNSVNPFQTINREDVGLTLGITPQINDGDTIKLKIKLEISSLASGSTGAVDLVTNKRTLNNTVNVDNGQILVLGGLLDDNLTETQRRVPFVSSIPVLGELFKYRSVDRTKRNLMLFIRPSILRSAAEGDYFTRSKYESLRQSQLDSDGVVPLIGGKRPLVRSYEEYKADVPAALTQPLPVSDRVDTP